MEDLLDSDFGIGLGLVNELGLEDDTEGTVADDLAVGVDEILDVAGSAIGGDDADDLAGVIDGWREREVRMDRELAVGTVGRVVRVVGRGTRAVDPGVDRHGGWREIGEG